MSQMIDRNLQGRDTGEGFKASVQDKDVRELLIEILMELRMHRLSDVRKGATSDLGDRAELEADVDPSWIEGE